MRFLFALISCFHICTLTGAYAQETTLSQPNVSASGEAYLGAVKYRGIDTDVLYFDPTQPAPPLDTNFKPQTAAEASDTSSSTTERERWIIGGVSLLVLVFLVAFVYFGAGRTSVSFRSSAENAHRKSGQVSPDQTPKNGDLPDLEALLKLGNRDLALTGLAQLALAKCLAANEVLFKRSWTHREALRSLPQTLWYIPDLRVLILESERVSFGHRSISEAEFKALLTRIRPILCEVRA